MTQGNLNGIGPFSVFHSVTIGTFREWIAEKKASTFYLFDDDTDRNQNPHRRRRHSMSVLKKRRISHWRIRLDGGGVGSGGGMFALVDSFSGGNRDISILYKEGLQ